jgi:ectoine hydroxylase-related dioxygenase (phytanoyl-CoA dioxygenase family)
VAVDVSRRTDAFQDLEEMGFAIVPGPIPAAHLVAAYDAAFARARDDETRVGRTSTKITNLVGREPLINGILAFPPLLEACRRVIGGPFKLSSFIGRTVRVGVPNQELHVDVQRRSADWPLLGFIVMVDDFRPDNGATRFVPGSHRWMETPEERMADVHADHGRQVLACGPAGSLLMFNGSVWHGHTATSTASRRSLQGAFIPRSGTAAMDFTAAVAPAR